MELFLPNIVKDGEEYKGRLARIVRTAVPTSDFMYKKGDNFSVSSLYNALIGNAMETIDFTK